MYDLIRENPGTKLDGVFFQTLVSQVKITLIFLFWTFDT